LSRRRIGTKKIVPVLSPYFPRSIFLSSIDPARRSRFRRKLSVEGRICPELVQTGLSSTLAWDFESQPNLFHTNFNRTVENFHQTLNRFCVAHKGVARKLLWGPNGLLCQNSGLFVAA
jgi:hypothetical protein